MPEIRDVHVDYGRTVSDGSYGSERYTVGLTASVGAGDDLEDVLSELCEQAREVVVARLKASTSEGVRAGMETREERDARWERERQETEARSAAEAAEAAEREELRRQRERDEDAGEAFAAALLAPDEEDEEDEDDEEDGGDEELDDADSPR